MKKSQVNFFISVVIGTCLLYYTFQYFEIGRTIDFIKLARTDYLLAALSLLIVAYVVRGARWMVWENNLKYWDSFKLILVGFMGNNIFPARLGEILRAHCAAEKIHNYHGRTATFASVVIERILDGFIIACAGIAGLLMVDLSPFLFWPLIFVCILFFILAAGLLGSIFSHEKIRGIMIKINRRFPGHLTRFGREKVNYFLDGLLLIRSPQTFIKALLITACIWGMELVVYYLIAKAVYSAATMKQCIIFLCVVNFASLFPFTIGGIGAIEGAATVYLTNTGIAGSESLAMVLIQHGYQFFFTTALGGIFFFTSRYYVIPLIQRTGKGPSIDSGIQAVNHDALGSARCRLNELSAELGMEGNGTRDIYLSIVIPAFNERERLPKTVLETIAWCRKKIPLYEILITDDGSTDDTLELARLFSCYDQNVRIITCPHTGKGAAVRMGMLNAVGNYVLFMDADGATPLTEIPKLLTKLDEGYAVAIGSRVIQSPGETKVESSLHRKIIGRTFAAIVNLFTLSGIADTQCGFKMFRKEIVKPLFSKQKIHGFAFDVEILFLAKKLSFPIAEVPVNWINQRGSKVNLVIDSLRMLIDVLTIRFKHREFIIPYATGEYNSGNE